MPLYESVADQEDLKASSFLVFATNLPKSSLEVKGHIPCSGNFEGENFTDCSLVLPPKDATNSRKFLSRKFPTIRYLRDIFLFDFEV